MTDIGKTVSVQYGTVLITDVLNSSHALGRVYQVDVTGIGRRFLTIIIAYY